MRPLLSLKTYLLCHKGMLAAALIALIVSAAATLAVPLAVRRMIDLGFSGIEPGLIDKYFITLVGIGLVLAPGGDGGMLGGVQFSGGHFSPCGKV